MIEWVVLSEDAATPFVAYARRWATREAAEGYIAAKFTYAHEFGTGTGIHSHFIVEKVTA